MTLQYKKSLRNQKNKNKNKWITPQTHIIYAPNLKANQMQGMKWISTFPVRNRQYFQEDVLEY